MQAQAAGPEGGNGGGESGGGDAAANTELKDEGAEPNHQEQAPEATREQELATAEDERQRNQEQEQQGSGDTEDPMSQPPHGTEVFISKVPREATDAQLRTFCEMAGEVYAMRVPKDRESNNNKGYCFCVFKNREAADKAMTVLEGREVKDFPGRRVNVVPSIVKNKLYIGQMPRDITKEELEALLKAEVVGLEKIELMMDKETNQARGFGFLAFYNNAAATLALRKLSRPEFRLRGHQVQVMWADPKRDEIGTEKVRSIYVGNLPEHYTENDLRSIFAQYGNIDRVTLLYTPEDPGKLRNYAFVNYTERSAAVRAVSEAEKENKKHTMGDKELIVHMAKPQAGRDDVGMGGMGMARGYGPGGYGYPPRGYGPPGRGGARGPGGRVGGRGGPGGGRGYGGGHGGGRGYHQADYGYGYEEGYDYGGYEEGYEEDYEGYGYGYGYSGYPSMPIMPVVVPSSQFGYVMGGAAATAGYHEGAGTGAGGPVRRGGGPGGPGPRERSAEGRGEGRAGGDYGASGGGYGGGGYGGSGGRGGSGYEDRGYGEKYPSRGEYGGGRAGSYEAAGGHRDSGGYGGGERYYGSGGHQGGRGGGAPSRGGYGGGERAAGGGGGYGERGYGERGYGERGYGGERSGGSYGASHYGGERGSGGYGGERAGGSYGAERGAGYGSAGGTPAYSAPPPPSRAPPAAATGSAYAAGGSGGYHGGSGGYGGGSGGAGRPSGYQGGSGSYTGGSGGSRPSAGAGAGGYGGRPSAGAGAGGYGGRGSGPTGPRYAPY
ncbi:hypothetical protein PLESTF_000070800 [Pleodorina starrii]|nr:hypothetical protein PLESTF_000070800 [Pleodorina starrii]